MPGMCLLCFCGEGRVGGAGGGAVDGLQLRKGAASRWCGLRQGRQIPLAAERTEGVDGGGIFIIA